MEPYTQVLLSSENFLKAPLGHADQIPLPVTAKLPPSIGGPPRSTGETWIRVSTWFLALKPNLLKLPALNTITGLRHLASYNSSADFATVQSVRASIIVSWPSCYSGEGNANSSNLGNVTCCIKKGAQKKASQWPGLPDIIFSFLEHRNDWGLEMGILQRFKWEALLANLPEGLNSWLRSRFFLWLAWPFFRILWCCHSCHSKPHTSRINFLCIWVLMTP